MTSPNLGASIPTSGSASDSTVNTAITTTTIAQTAPSAATSSSLPVNDNEDDDDDENGNDTHSSALPITLAASVVLTNIPKDSRIALTNAFGVNNSKSM